MLTPFKPPRRFFELPLVAVPPVHLNHVLFLLQLVAADLYIVSLSVDHGVVPDQSRRG